MKIKMLSTFKDTVAVISCFPCSERSQLPESFTCEWHLSCLFGPSLSQVMRGQAQFRMLSVTPETARNKENKMWLVFRAKSATFWRGGSLRGRVSTVTYMIKRHSQCQILTRQLAELHELAKGQGLNSSTFIRSIKGLAIILMMEVSIACWWQNGSVVILFDMTWNRCW